MAGIALSFLAAFALDGLTVGAPTATLTWRNGLPHALPGSRLTAIEKRGPIVAIGGEGFIAVGRKSIEAAHKGAHFQVDGVVESISLNPVHSHLLASVRKGTISSLTWIDYHKGRQFQIAPLSLYKDWSLPFGAGAYVSPDTAVFGVGPDVYMAKLEYKDDSWGPQPLASPKNKIEIFYLASTVERIASPAFVGMGAGASQEVHQVTSLRKVGEEVHGICHRMGGSAEPEAFVLEVSGSSKPEMRKSKGWTFTIPRAGLDIRQLHIDPENGSLNPAVLLARRGHAFATLPGTTYLAWL